ncbi:MFS transporter [Xanthobacteraceae bacterium Astr-EGSB]|uniref:MFS transporter n=1 Tax=Astrobacterium formosum TaxID=3069710 RepID=UPI0027B370A6|nr:MFS transporter [Xanthobacteraceae bacterium Astr-EGSB]
MTTPKKNEALWTRNFTLAFVINLLMSLVFYLLMTSMAPYAMFRFETSTGLAGLVTGVYIVGLMAGRVIIGRLIDELGGRKILILSSAGNLTICAFYLASSTLPLLITNRIVHGIIAGMCSTTTATLIAQMVAPNRRGEGIGFYSLSVILGAAMGPFVAVPMIRHAQFDTVLWLAVAAAAIALAMACFVEQPHMRAANPAPAKPRWRLDGFIDVSVLPIAVIGTVIALSFSGLVAFLSPYCGEIGLDGPAGWFFPVYSLAILVSRPFSGRLLDAKGANIIVYPALILYAVGMFLFSQAHSGSILLLAAVVIGFGYGNYQSSGQVIAIKGVPPTRLGVATSTYMLFYDFGYGLGPLLTGILVPFTGYRGLFLITVAVIVAALAMYHVLLGRRVIIE